jgi:cell division protein FtsL
MDLLLEHQQDSKTAEALLISTSIIDLNKQVLSLKDQIEVINNLILFENTNLAGVEKEIPRSSSLSV